MTLSVSGSVIFIILKNGDNFFTECLRRFFYSLKVLLYRTFIPSAD